MGKTTFRVEPEFFLTVALMIGYRQEATVGPILLFLLLHEMGHALVYFWGGGTLRGITVTAFGIRMEMGTPTTSRRWEIAAVMAGPVVNILAAAVAVWMGYRKAGLAGMVLGGYNLFPAHFLDGGLLVELVAEELGYDGRRITRWGSLVLSLFLAGVFLFAAWQGIFSVGLFFALLLSLLEYMKI